MFFDILYSRGVDLFQVWKNKTGQYEGKTRIRFKISGKRDGEMTYSRSITRNIVLRSYLPANGQGEQLIALSFEE